MDEMIVPQLLCEQFLVVVMWLTETNYNLYSKPYLCKSISPRTSLNDQFYLLFICYSLFLINLWLFKTVKLNGAWHVVGILHCFDPFMNLVVDETEEWKDGSKNNIGMVVSNVWDGDV